MLIWRLPELAKATQTTPLKITVHTILTPDTNSYGSIFYTITTLHAAHVIVGVLVLMYVGFQPHYGFARRSPHRPYEVATLYWHFVDAVWIFVVALLYVVPNIQRYYHVH